jgi:pantoate--beta-alanine ligase
MKIVRTLAQLREAKTELGPLAFVPTMGNLHAGHIALIEQAAMTKLPVAASIFVNRLQFAPHEDFDSYPRTFEADVKQLKEAGCSLLFAPTERDLYPEPQTFTVNPAPDIANVLEGVTRPGFFGGVCTVVMKLFCAVQPKIAVFGNKDFQQLMVVRRMVEQFAIPIEILGMQTVRQANGLAMSSRNGYLTVTEREQAIGLYQCLNKIVNARKTGPFDRTSLEDQAMNQLAQQGWQPDYIAIRKTRDLQIPTQSEIASGEALMVLGAAKLGSTRLIDNLAL